MHENIPCWKALFLHANKRLERQDQCNALMARKHGKADPTSYGGRGRSVQHTRRCKHCRGEP